MAGAVAPAAAAEPVSLGTLPEDSPVALAGDSVLVVRERRREFAVTSLPSGRAVARFPLVAGGPGFVQVAASATTATLVVVEPFGRRRFGAAQVFAGPPAGPFAPLGPKQRARRGGYLPYGAEVDGDRILLAEVRDDLEAYRSSVVEPGAPPRPLALPRSSGLATALAGDLVAFPTVPRGTRRGADVEARRIVVRDWRTGADRWSATLAGDEPDAIDLRADGRAVVGLEDGGVVEIAPGGTAVRTVDRRGRLPQFAGDAIVYVRRGAREGGDDRLMLAAPGAAARPFGVPASLIGDLDADDRRVVWTANGCVLSAALGDAAAAAPAAGPCPRSEVVLDDGHRTRVDRRTRRVAFVLRCVAAPPPGCRGTARLTADYADVTTVFRRRFLIPAGRQQRLSIRLSARDYRAAFGDGGDGGDAAFLVDAVTTDPDGRRNVSSDLLVARLGRQR
jgi:hypothetical protein